jgi:hypothetical protein
VWIHFETPFGNRLAEFHNDALIDRMGLNARTLEHFLMGR